MTATILDIHRSALDDGPGIRTTVFLKGCPMQCKWCHNPESINPGRELAFFKEKCIQCGACMDACPNQAHVVNHEFHTIDRGLCQTSGCCTEVCAYDALKISGVEMSVEEVMQVVMKDILYYKESGGGITVSGGEPMYHSAFTLELLKSAKKQGIHTCLDTSGFAPGSDFGKVLPFVDLFLYDYKTSCSDKHLELTSVPNELILENLRFLIEKGAAVELRCPLVPGVNDDKEHMKGIAQIKRKYPGLKTITLMPYHNTGNAKNDRYGYTSPLPATESAGSGKVTDWNSCLNSIIPKSETNEK